MDPRTLLGTLGIQTGFILANPHTVSAHFWEVGVEKLCQLLRSRINTDHKNAIVNICWFLLIQVLWKMM